MKDHGFDEKLWDPRLVEHRMNPDQALFGEVGAELERALPAFELNALAPGDPETGSCAKVPAGEVVRYRAEVVMAPV